MDENNQMNLTKITEEGLEYNTQRNQIVLGQYGRNIHKLVEYAMSLEDKEKRNLAAKQIIEAMEILNPKIRHIDDHKRIPWNHLAIMSGYRLDIDYPYEIIKEEEIMSKPEPIPVIKKRIKKRQYGRIIEGMIDIALEMDDKKIQEEFIKTILLQMKRIYIDWNKDVVSDEVIFEDFRKISDFKLQVPKNFKLPQSYEIRNKIRSQVVNKRYRKK